MDAKERQYLFLILIHIGIGVAVYLAMPFSKLYGFAILLIGPYWILKNRNENHEVLYVCAYIVGIEVFLRMTQGNIVYEFGKYGIMVFILLGMYFKGFTKNAIPYWLFLALMVPGIILGAYNLNYDTDLMKIISFNISGPLCLGLTALYTYRRRISLEQMNNILLFMGMPIITCATYLFLYTPSIRDVITGTGSNYEASGGFGPNQVATILGLGMFIFFSRIFYASHTRLMFIMNVLVAVYISYRGLVTFSRGGMITGAVMLIILIFVTYSKAGKKARGKLNFLLIFISLTVLAVWSYSSLETGGLIEKRYANQDAMGRVKKSRFTGREKISENEFKLFLSEPVFGVGVGKGLEQRKSETGETALSHNEITRMLAEHGSMGILGLLILFGTPFFLYLDNKQHLYMACFVFFWLLTINHAAMRLAAPAFVYALSILKISNPHASQPVVHRE